MIKVTLCILCALLCHTSAAEMKPSAVLHFEFPDLPPTLDAMSSGTAQPAMMTARLPENYTSEGQFPLFVYLLGGPGGRGEERHLKLGQFTIGNRDFIVVTMPLFKKKLDPTEPSRGLMVSMDDFPVIASSYRTMLEKLFATVPNITREHSTLGGHSNGAHTTGVLLAGQDEFLFQHFTQFFLQEGGIGPLFANVMQKTSMRTPRFMIMMGGRGFGPEPQKSSPFLTLQNVLQDMTSYGGKRDFTFVTMHGYGHDQPPEYLQVIGQWARGEPMNDIPAMEKALASKLTLPLLHHPDSSAWPDLINADLSNCTYPGGVWSENAGILTATKDENIWTKATHGDCVLDFEFKLEPGANSGVFIYNSDATNWLNTSIEIQLCDDAAAEWKTKPATWQCGAFFGHQAPVKSTVKPAGEWNRLTLTSQGPKLTIVINGELVNEIDLSKFTDGKTNPDGSEVPKWLQGKPWNDLPKQGRIGFQGRHADKGIQFRKIKWLRL
jgi:hypothetical protein